MKKETEICSRIIAEMEESRALDKEAALADMRFSFIEKLCAKCVHRPSETIGHKITVAADKILTGKYSAMFAFFAIMAVIFILHSDLWGRFCQTLWM